MTERNGAWRQAELLTAFVSNCPEMLSSERRSRDDFDRIMEH